MRCANPALTEPDRRTPKRTSHRARLVDGCMPHFPRFIPGDVSSRSSAKDPEELNPARDVDRALECGDVAAGQNEFKRALALRSEIRRAGWFN